MIRTSLTLLIWGLLAVVVDVNVGMVDVLFDPIAFGVIASALFSLAPIERNYAIAARFALGAIAASVAQLVFPDSSFISLASAVLQFFLLWYICTGVMRLAASQGKLPLSALAIQQRTLNAVGSASTLVTICIMKMAPSIAPLVVMLAFVFGIVVLVLTLLMLRQASRELVA
jgi:hypothetical protein